MTTARNTEVRTLTAEETASVSGGEIHAFLSETQFTFRFLGLDFGYMIGQGSNRGWVCYFNSADDQGTWERL